MVRNLESHILITTAPSSYKLFFTFCEKLWPTKLLSLKDIALLIKDLVFIYKPYLERLKNCYIFVLLYNVFIYLRLIDLNYVCKRGRDALFFLFKSLNTAAAAKSLQSCPTLCDPIDGSPPGSSFPGIFQARTLEWVAFPFPMHESEKWK